ncbi:hypothetical protein Taro_000748 [Colocasia esculenta]|uniref:G-patch domain-containing protein n=1 Tax=Colocasia esculenta TaxID=4460 RepID=A0A843TG15_COLES|nr:hypothetical protein [Colocasia esculenta]
MLTSTGPPSFAPTIATITSPSYNPPVISPIVPSSSNISLSPTPVPLLANPSILDTSPPPLHHNLALWSGRMFHRMYPNVSVSMPGQPAQQSSTQQQQDMEEIDLVPGTQYDIMKHLDQTPAKISILEMIKRSQTHRDALRAFLQRVMVSEDMNPDNLPSVLSIVNKGPTITFSDGELAAPEARKMPLCVTLTINKVAIDAALVDIGASINDVTTNAKGWNIMFRLGYQSGKGLGAHLHGRTKTVASTKKFTKHGLGYSEWAAFSSSAQSDHGPLTWTLYEHFFRGPVQPRYNTTVEEAPRSAYQALEAQRPNKKKRAETRAVNGLLFEESKAEKEELESEDLSRLFSENDEPQSQLAALSALAATTKRQLLGFGEKIEIVSSPIQTKELWPGCSRPPIHFISSICVYNFDFIPLSPPLILQFSPDALEALIRPSPLFTIFLNGSVLSFFRSLLM